MGTIESALKVINQYGGNLDVTTGKLHIPVKLLEEKAEIQKAVYVLKESGPDKVKAALASVQTHCQDCPSEKDKCTPLQTKPKPKPYLDAQGVLVIPFNSDPRYHWWAGGQHVLETLRELNAPLEVRARYAPGVETIQ